MARSLRPSFPSKEALAAEAFTSALEPGLEKMTGGPGRPSRHSDRFPRRLLVLSTTATTWQQACPMSASASEVARQDKIVCERFTEGFEHFVALIEHGLGASTLKGDKRQRAQGDDGRDDRRRCRLARDCQGGPQAIESNPAGGPADRWRDRRRRGAGCMEREGRARATRKRASTKN